MVGELASRAALRGGRVYTQNLFLGLHVVDVETGTVGPWSVFFPAPHPYSPAPFIFDSALDGDTVYFAVGNYEPQYLHAVDAQSARPLAWGGNGVATSSLAAADGRVLVGRGFAGTNAPVPRGEGVRAFDHNSQLSPWDPDLSGFLPDRT